MINAFPKIFAVGTSYICDLFKEPVEVTEKVDGSQFAFGKLDGVIYMRSKGAQIFPETPEAMFKLAVSQVQAMDLPEGVVFYCEYLKSEKHNILNYKSTPKNNLVLFAATVNGVFETNRDKIEGFANHLGIDPIPLLFSGNIENPEMLKALLETESYLGGQKVEGVVVKNYQRQLLIGGQVLPLQAGKLVRDDFKEVLKTDWAKQSTGKGRWETYMEGFRTPARWEKAVQHLQEIGVLTESPKDIGLLLKEVKEDVKAECVEEIKDFLWKCFGPDLLRKSVAGLPEWYKGKLLENANK